MGNLQVVYPPTVEVQVQFRVTFDLWEHQVLSMVRKFDEEELDVDQEALDGAAKIEATS